MDHKCESITRIIASANILKTVFDSDNFLKWLNKNHPQVNDNEIFLGYKFFLESAIGTLALSITLDRSLEIKQDYVYDRADFCGIDLNKLPVTCEKTAILKNILERQKKIKQATGFYQIKSKTEIFSTDILSPLFSIMNNHCSLNSEFTVEESLRFSTMEVAHNELTNFSKWVPQGYLLSPIRLRGYPYVSGSHKDEFKIEFTGYKYTLQYLWYCLLGENFEKTSAVDFHKATDWTRDRKWPDFDNASEETINRTDLDRFFPIIQKEIPEILDKKWDFLRPNSLFCLNESYSKKILEPLLSFPENLSLTIEEKLRYTLLWYNIELLDSSQNEIFNGVPAFDYLLTGAVSLKEKYANGEKAIICKFSHPGGSDKNEYSYGVLIETGGDTGFSDYSGWIICYNCCNDFTGFAGSGHRIAENFIKEYLTKDLIYLREMNIETNAFEKFLVENTTTGKKRDLIELKAELADTKRKYSDKIAESRGVLNEFLTYYTLLKREKGSIDWNIKINGDQLDVICENADSYRLIECKVDSKNINLDEAFEKLNRKLLAFKTGKQKIGQFWFYHSPSTDFQNYFNKLQKKYTKNNILFDDYEIISQIIRDEKTWHAKKIDKIQNIFDSKSLERQSSPRFNNKFDHNSETSTSLIDKILGFFFK